MHSDPHKPRNKNSPHHTCTHHAQQAYMRARDPEGAEDVLFRMAASGQAPDIHAYTILLRAYVCVCLLVWGGGIGE